MGKHYVVVGSSAAGINGAKKLRQLDKNAKITLISKDEHIYSRCILHHYIDGHRTLEELSFVDEDFFEKHNIYFMKKMSLTEINTENKTLYLSNNTTLKYDKLLLATGASSFMPPIEGLREAKNVFGLRNFEDAVAIKEAAQSAKNIVVMGAGLVGIDAVSGLLNTGKNISIVELGTHMLATQLDKTAARRYQKAFLEKGVKQYYNTGVERVVADANGFVKEIKLSNEETIACDMLIVAAGVRANISYINTGDIKTDKFGLVFNEKGETSVSDIYGAGDVSGRMPIWPVAVKEGIVAASNMAGHSLSQTDFFASKSTMNFLGIATLSLGTPAAPDETYTTEIKRDGKNYKKIIHKDGVIHGCNIQGDLAYAGVLTQLIREKINIERVKKDIFDIDYSDFFHLTNRLEFIYE